MYRLLQDNTFILWVDNFSKFLARSIPSLHSDVYSSCLWTGMAAFKCTQRYDMRIKYQVNGDVIAAMPDDILSTKSDVTTAITYIIQNQRAYYNNSTVRQYDVRNIPPKIDTKAHPHLADTIGAKHNSTHTVHPVKLLDHNIGSNQGLITVLRQIYEQKNMHLDSCENYMLLNVDENIYWRILKVHLFWFCMYHYRIYIIHKKPLNKCKIYTGHV